MVSIAITAFSIRMTSSSHQVKKTQKPQPKQSVPSFDTNKVTTINKQALTDLNKEADNNIASNSLASKSSSKNEEDDMDIGPTFSDTRWKNGTWDLNMFVEHGKIDWDGVIVSEAKRRKFLELFPQASTNQEPVLFRTSIVPWWAWMKRSLPEAELLNGRAAMVGFFMSYLVDALTRLDMVGQTGNFVCKTALFMTVIGVLVFRRKEDFDNLRKLADEATFYDKQWQSSWKDHKASDEIMKNQK